MNKGFTLLEVMIAMAVLVLAMGSIIAIEASSINATARAKQMNIVAMLAKNQMVEAEFKIYGRTFQEMKKEETGTFPAPYQFYTWKIRVKELKFPSLGAPKGGAASGGTGGAPGGTGGGESAMAGMVARVTANFLSKAIRELSVTIGWKDKGKDKDYTISTYWVDLNHEFSITE